MEVAQYTMYLSLKRIIIPKAITLTFLGLILYSGILLNSAILRIKIEAIVHLYIVMAIAVIILLQMILNYLKFSSYRYLFYKDRIIFQGKETKIILYTDIQNLSIKKDRLDSIFNTGTILATPLHEIKYVENINQVYFYLQKLIEYSNQMQPNYSRTNYFKNQNQPYYQRQVY